MPGPLYTAGMRKIVVLMLLALPALSQEHVDLGIVDRVKAEAFERSKVMETLRNLTDVHGPRLTGSPGFEDAARWAIGELNSYGLVGTVRQSLVARASITRNDRASLRAADGRSTGLERLQ